MLRSVLPKDEEKQSTVDFNAVPETSSADDGVQLLVDRCFSRLLLVVGVVETESCLDMRAYGVGFCLSSRSSCCLLVGERAYPMTVEKKVFEHVHQK